MFANFFQVFNNKTKIDKTFLPYHHSSPRHARQANSEYFFFTRFLFFFLTLSAACLFTAKHPEQLIIYSASTCAASILIAITVLNVCVEVSDVQ